MSFDVVLADRLGPQALGLGANARSTRGAHDPTAVGGGWGMVGTRLRTIAIAIAHRFVPRLRGRECLGGQRVVGEHDPVGILEIEEHLY